MWNENKYKLRKKRCIQINVNIYYIKYTRCFFEQLTSLGKITTLVNLVRTLKNSFTAKFRSLLLNKKAAKYDIQSLACRVVVS